MKKLIYTAFFALGTLAASAQSALFVDTTIAPAQMVADFFNTAQVSVSNVEYTGSPQSAGFFEAAGTDLDLLAGLMLSSGKCSTAADSVQVFASDAMFTDGDDDLSNLQFAASGSVYETYDASVLEFDFVPQTDTLCFIYRFASEEYPEYACSNYNDIFAFFVSGPGFTNLQNVALIPNTATPVAINTIHPFNPVYVGCFSTNMEYYVDYQALNGQHAVYDGFTVTLPAKFAVQPGETYHAKLALADVGDQAYNSGVFLSVNSLGGDSLLVPVAELAAPTVEGNTVTFVNDSRYGTSWHWDFGDGTSSDERHPAPHTFPLFGPAGESSTVYTVRLITQNYCCADTATTLVQIGSSSTSDLAAEEQFVLAPNPASDWLAVSAKVAGAFEARIVDVSGRVLAQQSGAGTIRFEVARLERGVYLLECRQGQSVARQRFVRQ